MAAGLARIRAKTNGGSFAKDLSAWSQGVLEANVNALNWTAYNTREALYDEFSTKLKAPTPKTMRSLLVKKATISNPEAQVYTKFGGNKEVPPGRWLDALVEGGARRMKSSELKLNSYLVPSKFNLFLDQYGNAKGSDIKRMLSQLRLAGDQSATDSKRSKAKRSKAQYFLRGKIIFLRQKVATVPVAGGKNTGSRIVPQFILVDKTPHYSAIIDWDGVAQRTFDRDYDRLFAKALAAMGGA